MRRIEPLRPWLRLALASALCACSDGSDQASTSDPIFGGGDATGSCQPVFPDPSTAPHLESPWNPLADGLQNGLETAVDLGGTWATPAPQIPTPVATQLSIDPNCRLDPSGTSTGACTPNGAIPGRRIAVTLNGIDYRCFFPDAPQIPEKVVVLNTRATIGNGSMHENNDKYSFPVSDTFHGSCGYFPPHAGHPVHLSVRGIVALGIYLKTNYPDDVDKFVLAGQSYGSFLAPSAALLGQGHPMFPVAGVVGTGGYGVQENPVFFDGMEFVLGVNQANLGVYGPFGEDAEVIRTFQESLGIDSLANIDIANYVSNVVAPCWFGFGQQDPTTWTDYQTQRLAQLFPSGTLVHVFHTELGSHKGDGIIRKVFGVHDPYAGQDTTLDLLEFLDHFINFEVLGQPLPVAPPVDLTATQHPPSPVDFVANLSPDLSAGPTGLQPDLLTLERRIGLGAYIGAHDSLLTHVDAQGRTRVTFGGLSGVVQQVIVEAGGVQPVWRRPVGYGVSGLVDVGNERIVAITKDGRAALLRRGTGAVVRSTAAQHLGHEPRGAQLGVAYTQEIGQPVPHELVFVLEEGGDLIGFDPADLSVRFRSDRLGFFEDFDFTPGAPLASAWFGMQRGHLVRAVLQLPDCIHVAAMTEYTGRVPTKVLAIGENVLAIDDHDQRLYLSTGVEVPLTQAPNTLGTALIGTDAPSVSLEHLALVPGTTFALWSQVGGRVGLTDLAAASPGQPIPPLATGNVHGKIMALDALSNRAFATTANGALLDLLVGGSGIVPAPLHPPLSTTAVAQSSTTGHLLTLTRTPHDGETALLDVDLGPNGGTQILSTGYTGAVPLRTRLVWSNGMLHTTFEGALATIGGQPRVFAPRSFDFGAVVPTEGHLTSWGVFPPQLGTGNVPIVAADLLGPEIQYEKYTNNMAGIFNENGSGLMRLDADGHYTGFFATAGGHVFRQRFDGATAQALAPAVRSESFGWKGADLKAGVHRMADGTLVDALFVGLWLLSGRDEGGVVVVDPQTLQLLAEIPSGDVSYGVLQADVSSHPGLELVVGSAKHLTVYDAQYQVLFRTPEESTAYGAFGRLWFDGTHLDVGTLDGYERYVVSTD